MKTLGGTKKRLNLIDLVKSVQTSMYYFNLLAKRWLRYSRDTSLLKFGKKYPNARRRKWFLGVLAPSGARASSAQGLLAP